MNMTTLLWLSVAFVAGVLAVGIPYWDVPYSSVSLPGTLWNPMLIVVAAGAGCARAFGKAGMAATVFIVGGAVPAAVMVRVLVETTADPTSHNLWPFEVVIALVIGLVCSLAGALGGSLLRRFSGRS
jgi:hypothetical protein